MEVIDEKTKQWESDHNIIDDSRIMFIVEVLEDGLSNILALS